MRHAGRVVSRRDRRFPHRDPGELPPHGSTISTTMDMDSYAHMLNRPVIPLSWPAAIICTAQHGHRG